MKLGYFGGRGTPNIDTARQADDKVILLTPINQVQVIVVLEGRRIQHLVGYLWYLAALGLGYDYRVLIKSAEGRFLKSEEITAASVTSKNVLLLNKV